MYIYLITYTHTHARVRTRPVCFILWGFFILLIAPLRMSIHIRIKKIIWLFFFNRALFKFHSQRNDLFIWANHVNYCYNPTCSKWMNVSNFQLELREYNTSTSTTSRVLRITWKALSFLKYFSVDFRFGCCTTGKKVAQLKTRRLINLSFCLSRKKSRRSLFHYNLLDVPPSHAPSAPSFQHTEDTEN